MISSINNYLQHIFHLYPVRSGIFLLSILILYISYRLYRYKLSIKYKITYSWLNYLAVSTYILYYIVILLIIRFYMFNSILDLNPVIDSIKELHKDLGILFIFLLFTLWILFIICLIKIRKILLKEIIKLYISLFFHYGYFKSKYYRFVFENKYLNRWWYWKREISIVSWDFVKFVINLSLYKDKKRLIERLGKSNKISSKALIIFRITPLVILVLLFLYDIVFNSCIITKIFYYLPFYFLFNLWYQINTFLGGNNRLLDQVIYERYYQIKDIVYSNITDEEEESLQMYMRNGFKYEYTDKDLIELIPPILYYRRFVREPGTKEFYNVETGEGFEIEDIDKFLKESPDTPNV